MKQTDTTMENLKSEFEKKAANFTESDMGQVLAEKDRTMALAMNQASLVGVLPTILDFFGMIDDYASGQYKKVPFRTIAAIGGALLYLIIPFDVVPDFIPLVGFVDDATVLTFCSSLVYDDIVEYRKWKTLRGKRWWKWTRHAPNDK